METARDFQDGLTQSFANKTALALSGHYQNSSDISQMRHSSGPASAIKLQNGLQPYS
jgi:hypothetical protein